MQKVRSNVQEAIQSLLGLHDVCMLLTYSLCNTVPDQITHLSYAIKQIKTLRCLHIIHKAYGGTKGSIEVYGCNTTMACPSRRLYRAVKARNQIWMTNYKEIYIDPKETGLLCTLMRIFRCTKKCIYFYIIAGLDERFLFADTIDYNRIQF